MRYARGICRAQQGGGEQSQEHCESEEIPSLLVFSVRGISLLYREQATIRP